MKILVTGGAGFIGSHAVDHLLAQGHELRILDSLAPPVHLDGQVPAYVPADVELVIGDVRDRDLLRRALGGVEAVVHLAAYQDYLPDFSKFFHINTVGTALLYELIVADHLPVRKVVVASSQAVYGEGKYRCATHGVVYPGLRPEAQLQTGHWDVRCPHCAGPLELMKTDEAVVNPHNQYAMSKYTQEMIALNLGQRYQIPSVALRFSITQGPRQSFRNAYSGILRIFTMAILHGDRPIAYEDGLQLRDYVGVADVARAIDLVLHDDRADYRAFNVGGARAVTVLDYAALVAEICESALTPQVPGEYRFGDTRHIISDIGRLSALGWEPRTSLHETIRGYVAWAQSEPSFANYAAGAAAVMRRLGTVRSVT